MKPPRFWQKGGNRLLQILLWPGSLAWRVGSAARRATVKPRGTDVPVICVGNLELGGTGKTPTVRLLSAWFAEHDVRTGVLSRGYGGSLSGSAPVLIDPAIHTAAEVGDEPLLHAMNGPVVISPDRAAGAALLRDHCDVILMDDGHQNQSLIKDLSLVVTRASEGFGNGAVFPAGPLRETIAEGLARANAIVAIGGGILDRRLSYSGLPLIRARLQTQTVLEGQRVFGFCGIGKPEGFRQTLKETHAEIVGFRSFSDHHPFTRDELQGLVEQAKEVDAHLVTTEKDAVRLPSDFKARVMTISVELHLDQPELLDALLLPVLASIRMPASGAAPTNRS
jgi:tetraacyldisaccharide 4'-kinase